MNYYFSENKSRKGLVGFSLALQTDPETPVEYLQERINASFLNVNLAPDGFSKFLARYAVLPQKNGYVEVVPGAVIYVFDGLSSAFGETVQDSLLFSVFSLARQAYDFDICPDSQAIIVTGDFDSKAMLAKMQTIGFTVPFSDKKAPDYDFSVLTESPTGNISRQDGPITTIKANWSQPHISYKYMNTVLPVVADKLSGEFRWILYNRLFSAFKLHGLRAWLDFEYINSAMTFTNESMTMNVSCMKSEADAVEKVVKEEFDRLLTYGVDLVEYSYARDAYKYYWYRRAEAPMHANIEYSRRCVSSFLFGASLANEQTKMKVAYKDVPDSTQTKFFNHFIKGLLKQTSTSREDLQPARSLDTPESISNNLNKYVPSSSFSFKKGMETTEYITGGKMWTMPNGLNVLYKKASTSGINYFCYAAKGGRAQVDEENFSTIDGIYIESYNNYLASLGIVMNLVLNPADVRLQGSVSNENTEQMLCNLVALQSQPGNAEVFGPNCYKLLVMVSDMDEEQVRNLVLSYATVLGPSAKWKLGSTLEEDTDDVMGMRGYMLVEAQIELDRTTGNAALADMASSIFRSKVAERFAGIDCSFIFRDKFSNYPEGRYKISCGVRQLFTEGTETRLSKVQVKEMIKECVMQLAVKPLPDKRLSEFKTVVKNKFNSASSTPQFIITAATDRYLDNKDLTTRYVAAVDKVTSGSLQELFASVYASLSSD